MALDKTFTYITKGWFVSMYLLRTILDYTKIGLSFLVRLLAVLANLIWGVISFIFSVVYFIVYLIFEPFNLIIKIIDFNTRQFLNVFLRLFFNTKIERILSYDNGIIHFKIFVEWLRFFNVMCITGLILGILTYYTIIRVIYWLTTLEKKVQVKVDDLTRGRVKIEDINDNILDFDDAKKKIDDQFSILDNYLDKYSLNPIKVEYKQPTVEDSTSSINNTDNESSVDEDTSKPFLYPTEDQEEDSYDRELVQSLSSNSSFSINSHNNPQTPINKSFYPRVSTEDLKKREFQQQDTYHSDEQDIDTVTSSIFSTGINSTTRTSRTPITIVEEDEEEQKM